MVRRSDLLFSLPASLAIALVGFFMGVAVAILPKILFHIPICSSSGVEFSGLGCAIVGILSIIIISCAIVILGVVGLYVFLQRKQIRNLNFLFAATFLFYYAILPHFGVNEFSLFTSYHSLYIIPLFLLIPYWIIAKLQIRLFGHNLLILNVVILVAIVMLVFGGINLWKDYNIEKIRPEIEKVEQIENPKTFIETYRPINSGVTLKQNESSTYLSPFYPYDELATRGIITKLITSSSGESCSESRNIYLDTRWRLFWIEIGNDCESGDRTPHNYGPFRYTPSFHIPNVLGY